MTDEELVQKFGEIVDKRIAERLIPLDQRFDSLDSKIDGIGGELDSLEKQTKTLNRKLTGVAKDISYISRTFDEGIVGNSRRIKKIEEKLGLQTSQ